MKVPVDQQFLKDSDRPNNHSRSLQSSLPTLMLGWNSKSSPRLHAEMPSAVAVWLADEPCVLPSELTSVPNKAAGMCIAHSDNLLSWNEASECRGLSIDAAVVLSMVLKAAAKSQTSHDNPEQIGQLQLLLRKHVRDIESLWKLNMVWCVNKPLMTVMRFAEMNHLLQVICRLSADRLNIIFLDIFAVKKKKWKKKLILIWLAFLYCVELYRYLIDHVAQTPHSGVFVHVFIYTQFMLWSLGGT